MGGKSSLPGLTRQSTFKTDFCEMDARVNGRQHAVFDGYARA